MKHITPEVTTALANFNTALRLLNGVTDDNKRAHHEANTRTTARNVMHTLDLALAEVHTKLLNSGVKVGEAGKFTITRRGKVYEETIETFTALKALKVDFAKANAIHLSTPVTAIGGDSTRWPSWAWAKR